MLNETESTTKKYRDKKKGGKKVPAKSIAQRRAAGMARAIQKGEMDPIPDSPAAEMAEMETESLEHFAKTKEAGLPRRLGSKGQRKPGGRVIKKGLRRAG